MRIGYLNDRDLNNPNSHTPHFMFQIMKMHPECEVINLNTRGIALGKSERYKRHILGLSNYTAYTRYRWSKELSQIVRGDFDVIFACFSSTILDTIEADIPIIYSSDATFRQSVGYQRFDRFHTIGTELCDRLDSYEANAIERAKLCIYPSAWALESAINDYGMPRRRSRCIERGPNIIEDLHGPIPHTPIDIKNLQTIFIGRDWEKKGGDLAIECIEILRSRGVDITITIVGPCPDDVAQLPYVHALGNIDKQNRQAYQTFLETLTRSVLHIFPTTAEPTGIVIVEAAAHGCPTISTGTGGLATTIQDGQTGVLMAPSATAEDWADQIMELLKGDCLTRMGTQARHDYETRLNWRTWCDRTVKAMKHVLEI